MVSTVSDKSAPDAKSEKPRNVLLLPSHLFFVRSIALPAGISPEELPSFVELSLEEMSPFAINQLYYGYFLPAGEERVLVFAAYRKQLAVYEEDPSWIAADLVLPDFTAALGISRSGPTLAFIQDDHELTAIYWSGEGKVPERVLSRHLEPVDDTLPVERVREELRRRVGPLPGNVRTVYLANPAAGIRDRNLVCHLEEEGKTEKASAEIARATSLPMDIRDKAFLLSTRRTQRQNHWLWAGVLTVLAGFLALGLLEGALAIGRHFLSTREANILALEPEVNRIQQEEQLANRLAELNGERLLPFEILAFLNRYRPPSIYYTSARLPARERDEDSPDRRRANRLRSFEIEARTPRSQDVDRFQRLLENETLLERVEIRNLRLRAQDGLSSFTLVGTFREAALQGFSSPGASEPADEEAPPAEDQPVESTEADSDADSDAITIPKLPEGELPEGDIQLPSPELDIVGEPLPQVEPEDEDRSEARAAIPVPQPPADEENGSDETVNVEGER